MKKLFSTVVHSSVLLLIVSSSAFAKLKVVTTLPSFADIAKNVGGDEIQAVSLTKGTQDPHFVDAKPDLILQLNRADLLVNVGLGLEDGWLPSLLIGSRNGKIQVGSNGNFNVSSVMTLKEIPTTAVDRSMGDVHPGGNPHYMLDPRNGGVYAKALAERLGVLDPSHAADYKKRAGDYVAKLDTKIQEWQTALKPLYGTQVITYHKSWIYFTEWIGLKEVGYVEPKPGITPSPEHTVKLIMLMKEKKLGLILMEPFYPKGVAAEVAKQAKAKLLVLPSEVNGSPDATTYFGVFDTIMQTFLK